MTTKAYELTGLENPNSVSQLKTWLDERGISMDTLGKKNVTEMIGELDKNGVDAEAMDMLKLRLQMAKSSVKKYQAAERCVCPDGRARGLFQFYGASRTGRYSGRNIQLQNLPQNHISTLDEARTLVKMGCFDMVESIYAMNDAVYTSLIKLSADICKRNGKTKLIWLADKNKTLNYTPAADEMVLSVHRWFAAKACPGDWLYARLGDLAAKVTAALGTPAAPVTTGLQATALKALTDAEVVAKVAPLFTANQKQSGILASVSLAQFILESGYGKSELAQNANNCFGMKKSLSGNSWAGSAWDGQSVYTKQTGEQNPDGSYETITADFRTI